MRRGDVVRPKPECCSHTAHGWDQPVFLRQFAGARPRICEQSQRILQANKPMKLRLNRRSTSGLKWSPAVMVMPAGF